MTDKYDVSSKEVMPPETLEALRGSIAKWEAILDGSGGDDGGDNCPLCIVFRNRGEDGCEGCPVAGAAGNYGCQGTPYDEWNEYHDEAQHDMPYYARTGDEQELASAEFKFLISLLPRDAT